MRTSAMAVMAVTGLGLAVTGCADGTGTGGPSASPTTSVAPSQGGSVASCVAGTWRSTSANGQAKGAMASATINGGSGVGVKVSPTGDVTVDFTKMQPLNFTAQVADAKVAGSFTYAGTATGKVRTGADGGMTAAPATPSASATSAGAGGAATATPGTTPSSGTGTSGTSGTWEPIPPINWGDARLTLNLTQPVKGQPFKDVKVADYVGDGAKQSGDVVDIEPLLGQGLFECSGDTLVLTPKDERGIAWTLTKA